MRNLSKSRKVLLRAYGHREGIRKRTAGQKASPDDLHDDLPPMFYLGGVSSLAPYIEAGFVLEENGKPTINEHMAETVNHFIRFLCNRQIIDEADDQSRLNRHLWPAWMLELLDEKESPVAEKGQLESVFDN